MSYRKSIEALFWGIGVVLFFFFGGGPEKAEAKTRIPRIHVLLEEIDFGEVRAGSTVTQEFIVRNYGNGLLKILQVRPG